MLVSDLCQQYHEGNAVIHMFTVSSVVLCLSTGSDHVQ